MTVWGRIDGVRLVTTTRSRSSMDLVGSGWRGSAKLKMLSISPWSEWSAGMNVTASFSMVIPRLGSSIEPVYANLVISFPTRLTTLLFLLDYSELSSDNGSRTMYAPLDCLEKVNGQYMNTMDIMSTIGTICLLLHLTFKEEQ